MALIAQCAHKSFIITFERSNVRSLGRAYGEISIYCVGLLRSTKAAWIRSVGGCHYIWLTFMRTMWCVYDARYRQSPRNDIKMTFFHLFCLHSLLKWLDNNTAHVNQWTPLTKLFSCLVFTTHGAKPFSTTYLRNVMLCKFPCSCFFLPGPHSHTYASSNLSPDDEHNRQQKSYFAFRTQYGFVFVFFVFSTKPKQRKIAAVHPHRMEIVWCAPLACKISKF